MQLWDDECKAIKAGSVDVGQGLKKKGKGTLLCLFLRLIVFLNISFKELNNLGKKLQPPIRMFRKKIGAGKVTNGKWREDALILTETVGPEYIAEVLC